MVSKYVLEWSLSLYSDITGTSQFDSSKSEYMGNFDEITPLTFQERIRSISGKISIIVCVSTILLSVFS